MIEKSIKIMIISSVRSDLLLPSNYHLDAYVPVYWVPAIEGTPFLVISMSNTLTDVEGEGIPSWSILSKRSCPVYILYVIRAEAGTDGI